MIIRYAQANGGNYNGWDVAREAAGTALVEWGQPYVPKSGGVGGGGNAGKWTSGASKTLRGADKAIQARLGTKATLPFKVLGTKGIGAAAGRLVPFVGWGLLAYDIYDNRWALQAMQKGLENYNSTHPIEQPGNLIYHICFVKGTLIYTTKGYKPIETITLSDSVYSYNFDKNKIEKNKVTKVFERTTKEIYLLNTKKEQIEVTAEHPFYVQDKGWIKVKDLQTKYVLKTMDNKTELIKITVLIKEERVYNVEVEGNHNYFISKSKILVHNK